MQTSDNLSLIELTSNIVGAFVANNPVRAAELTELIAAVHAGLHNLTAPKAVAEPAPELKPAVSVRKSMTEDFMICLDDGKKFKSLKRHLAGLGMTPDDYRAKWGLPKDYPMVAPGYAAERSKLAKAIGLGRKSLAPQLAAPAPANDAAATKHPAAGKVATAPDAVAAEAPAKRRGRPKKAA